MFLLPIYFEEPFLNNEKWPNLNGANKNNSCFLHSSLMLSYARNIHFSEYSRAVGRGFPGTAGTVSLITQERSGLKWPSYKSLLITLIIVQWWKEEHFKLPYGETGALHVLWTCLKKWALKVIGLGLEEHFTWLIMHEIGAEFSELSGAHFFWQVPDTALVSET